MRGAEALRSFIAAAEGVAIARGPHLVAMLNAFEANGTAYAVMEREEGTDLAQLALSAGQLLAIAEGTLGALERLHRAGRDPRRRETREPAHRAWAKGAGWAR